jgi:hypothetical protein
VTNFVQTFVLGAAFHHRHLVMLQIVAPPSSIMEFVFHVATNPAQLLSTPLQPAISPRSLAEAPQWIPASNLT